MCYYVSFSWLSFVLTAVFCMMREFWLISESRLISVASSELISEAKHNPLLLSIQVHVMAYFAGYIVELTHCSRLSAKAVLSSVLISEY